MTGMNYECNNTACKMPTPPEGNIAKRPGLIETNHEMQKVLLELNNVLVELNNTVVFSSAVMPEVADPTSLTDAVQSNLLLAKEALDGAMKLRSAI